MSPGRRVLKDYFRSLITQISKNDSTDFYCNPCNRFIISVIRDFCAPTEISVIFLDNPSING